MDSNNSDDNHSQKTFYTNGVDKCLYEDDRSYHKTQYESKESFNLLYQYRSSSMEFKEVDRQIYYLLQKHKHNKSDKKMKYKRLYKEYLKDFGCLLEVESYYNLVDFIPLDKLKKIIEKFKLLKNGLETLTKAQC